MLLHTMLVAWFQYLYARDSMDTCIKVSNDDYALLANLPWLR